MAARVKVSIDSIHFPYMEYFDWLATGLWMLDEAGEIEARIATTATSAPFQWHAKAYPALRRLAPGLAAALAGGGSTIVTGKVEAGGRSLRFVFDAGDSPYAYQTDLLVECDLYFKAQCPISFDPRGFPIARDAWFPYHPDVLAYQHRIVPTMLGRPLSRRLHRRDNAQVLKRWQQLAQATKTTPLFAYYGLDDTASLGGPERIVLQRFAGKVEHPNPKRGKLVEELRQRYGQNADVRIVLSQSAARRGPKLGDEAFRQAVAGCWHNINVSGYRRSLPFRFVDSFLVGAAVPTDELALRWYAPFEEGTETIDLGPMGYELDAGVDWPRIFGVFDRLVAETPEQRRDRQRRILSRFEQYWHPRVMAKQLVDRCLAELA